MRTAAIALGVVAALAGNANAQQRGSTYEEHTLVNGHGRLLEHRITTSRDCMARCIANPECGYWIHIDIAELSCRLHAGKHIQREMGGDRLRLHTSGVIYVR